MAERPQMKAGNRKNWGNRSPLHPSMLKARFAEERALELRLQGYSFREIGKEMGTAMQTARLRVARALDRCLARTQEKADEVRLLEIARLDAMAQRVWPYLYDPNRVFAATRSLIAIMERRAHLLGLDAPKAVTIAPGQAVSELPDDELQKLLMELRQRKRMEMLSTGELPEANPESEEEDALPWDPNADSPEEVLELLEGDDWEASDDEEEPVGGGGGQPGAGENPPSTPPPPTPAANDQRPSVTVMSSGIIEI